MTDGERMLWIVTYRAQLDRGGSYAAAVAAGCDAVWVAREMAKAGTDYDETRRPIDVGDLAMLREAIGWTR